MTAGVGTSIDVPERINKGEQVLPVLVAVVGFCMLVQRLIVLQSVGLQFTDLDQVLMWQAAREFSRGHIYEPCFWGQDYNSMLEGAVAAPLLWVGISPVTAVPLITGLLALLPFLLFAGLAVSRRYWPAALGCLILPCVINPRFAIISGLSRGFIPGITIASFGAFVGLRGNPPLSYFWFGALSCLGVSIMPNAMPVAITAGLLIWAARWRDLRWYGWGTTGIVAGATFAAFSWYFYHVRNPEYLLFPSFKTISFSLQSLLDALGTSGSFFDDLLPPCFHGIWGAIFCWVGLTTLLVTTGQMKSAGILSVLPFLIIGMLLNPKVHNASPSIFYSYSRFFLGVPYAVGLLVGQIRWSHTKGYVRYVLCLVCFGIVGGTFSSFSERVAEAIAEDSGFTNPVGAMKTIDVVTIARRLGEVQGAAGVSAFVFNELFRMPGLAGAALYGADDFRSFIFNDRRRWFMARYGDAPCARIGFYGFPPSLRAEFISAGFSVVPQSIDGNLFVIEAGGKSLLQLLRGVKPELVPRLLAITN